MSQPADETRLGELLVTTGKLSSEELLAALEAQRQQGGPQRKRLGEILVEQGHVSFNEIETVLTHQDKQILWCPRCRVQVNVQGTVPGGRYACRQCQGELQPAPPPRSAAVRETWRAAPVPDSSTENLSEEVRQALADPSRRIGRYAVLSELGRGGMGVVYRCYDPQLNRNVAIKMLLEGLLPYPDQDAAENLARFTREARATARLQHPGIVALHEVGEHQGKPYLVMDFVEGRSFEALLQREKPTARRIVEIIRDMARALDHAHDVGITHRDVKPQNVMVDSQGKPQIMDFGLARDSSARQQLTQTGQIMGTPAYMAPEQANADTGTQGPWTDVYALGAVIYRALSGRPVFQAASPASMLKQILLDEPKPLRRLDPTISADLETIALKCLEKEPNRRYPSAAAVAEELGRFLDGQAILARPLSRSERAMRWTRRNRALALALGVVAVVVVGATVVVLDQATTAKRERVQIQEAARQEKEQIQREAVRREERARLNAERKAASREEAALAEAAREREAEALATLHTEVTAVLDRVWSGEIHANRANVRIERSKLLKHQHPETVRLLTAELDALGKLLADSHELSHGQELFLHFLCRTLADLSLQEGAVASIGGYLKTELALPENARNQLRAVPAGEALCVLGGKEADQLLLEAREGFGINGSFWGQVEPFYKRTGVEPVLEKETAQGFLNRGLARQAKGDLDGAIADYTRVLEINPNDATAWVNIGLMREAKGDLDRAIADYTRAIEIDPNLAAAWINRGLAREAKGDLDGTIRDASRAIEIDPNLAAAWFSRGLARGAKGDLDGAIADYSRAIEIDPNGTGSWVNRGNARQAKGDLEGAIADLTRAIDIDPNLAQAWGNRGVLRERKGDLDGAIADHTRAIEIQPNFADAWVNRGIAREAKGDLDGAIADYTRILEIQPNLAMAWFNCGLARQAKGDLDGAIADFQRVLEVAPNAPQAPAIRAMLEQLQTQQRAKAGAGADK